MLIIGAKGHAQEIIEILFETEEVQQIVFFDGIKENHEKSFYSFPIIKTLEEVKKLFHSDKNFCLGLGNPINRLKMDKIFTELGGNLVSIISPSANIHRFNSLSQGVNIMAFALISNNVRVGRGVIVNAYASIHHDSCIGDYTEIGPGARILGGCRIGSNCSLGANAVILPGVEVYNNISIGAGCIVTETLKQPGTYVGVPAKKIHNR